ncbi:MAG: response regulator [Betaproteobacteria bacterium]|nr:response regulator [Betaproteobacteria bacterium]
MASRQYPPSSEPADDDEQRRLEALHALGILDTAQEPGYDQLTALAAQLCDTPIALVSLVDEHRQWFKSHFGLDLRQTGRAESFCAHAVAARAPLVVTDASADERFERNPLVTGDPGIRAYAGVPLYSRSGQPLGTLCVIDRRPRPFGDAQLASLKVLAQQVETLFELRATGAELQRREQTLSHFEALIAEAQTLSDSLLWEWNVRSGSMKYSRSFSEMMGYPESEDDQHFDVWIERTHPEDGPATWALIKAHIKGDIPKYEAQYRQRHAQGHWVWMHSRGRVVERDSAGRAIRMVGVVSDIDRSKRIEQQLERANAELARQVQRAESLLRSKSQFLANVAHEIRTPLNSIVGGAQLALMAPSPEQQREDISMIHASSQSLLALVNRVLDMSRLEAGALQLERTVLWLPLMAQGLVQQFQPQARQKGVDFDVVVSPQLPSAVWGDGVRLHQVLVNLIGNALKFTEAGSVRVVMDCEPGADIAGAESSGITHNERRLRLSVQDTGVGLSREQIGRLFGRFQQADDSVSRRFGGTGLGLYISRELLTLMGGTLDVDSEPGRGSQFIAKLPLEEAVGADIDAPPPSTSAPTGPSLSAALSVAQRLREAAQPIAGRSVLVVDDNPANRIVVDRFLREAGLRSTSAESAHEAMLLLQQEHYDAVLMDLYMPEMNGDDAARRIRTQHPGRRVPIIAVSASVTAEEAQRCRDAGMNGFMAKPVDPLALIEVLREQLHDAQTAQASSSNI